MAQTQLAGEVILAEDIVVPGFVLKGTNEAVTSSVTLQNDDELFTTLTVGRWRVELVAHCTGIDAGDINIGWTFGGTATTQRVCYGPAISSSNAADGTMQASARALGTAVSYTTATNTSAVKEDLFLDVSVAGVLQMQWCQRVSNASATNVTSGSRLFITQFADA